MGKKRRIQRGKTSKRNQNTTENKKEFIPQPTEIVDIFHFQTESLAARGYKKFIDGIIDHFCVKEKGILVNHYGCYLLPEQATTSAGKHELLFKIVLHVTIDNRKKDVGLFFRSDNFYYIGFNVELDRYEFLDENPILGINCPSLKAEMLRFDSQYGTLESESGILRCQVVIGQRQLTRSAIALIKEPKNCKVVARSSMVFLIHFPESLRFFTLCNHICANFNNSEDNEVKVGSKLSELFAEWSTYSRALHLATKETVEAIRKEIEAVEERIKTECERIEAEKMQAKGIEAVEGIETEGKRIEREKRQEIKAGKQQGKEETVEAIRKEIEAVEVRIETGCERIEAEKMQAKGIEAVEGIETEGKRIEREKRQEIKAGKQKVKEAKGDQIELVKMAILNLKVLLHPCNL